MTHWQSPLAFALVPLLLAVMAYRLWHRRSKHASLQFSRLRELMTVPPGMAAKTYAQMREGDRESARLHLESIKRILAQEAPDFAQ